MERSYSNNLGRRSPKEYFETGPLAYEEILFEDIVDGGRTDVRTDVRTDGRTKGRTDDGRMSTTRAQVEHFVLS